MINYINKYTEERKKGKGFSEIRKELNRSGVSGENIREIIRQIDNNELKALKRKNEKSKSLNIAFMGLFIFIMGSGITIYSFWSGNSETTLWYGAILVGLGMFANGIIQYKRN